MLTLKDFNKMRADTEENYTLLSQEKIKDLVSNLQKTVEIQGAEFKHFDKRLEKIDTRLWGIIMLLLAYPLGLIVGKLCHLF